MDLTKIIVPFEYVMKLTTLNFNDFVHPSNIIVHSYVFHFSLFKLTQLSVFLYSISKYLFLIHIKTKVLCLTMQFMLKSEKVKEYCKHTN